MTYKSIRCWPQLKNSIFRFVEFVFTDLCRRKIYVSVNDITSLSFRTNRLISINKFELKDLFNELVALYVYKPTSVLNHIENYLKHPDWSVYILEYCFS